MGEEGAEAWRPVYLALDRAGSRDLASAPVYVGRADIAAGGEAAARFLRRVPRLPLVGEGRGQIAALRLGPEGRIDEHAADEDIVVLTWRGAGRSRVGGAGREWVALAPGAAVLWPRGLPHLLEAGAEGIEVFAVHLAAG